MRKTQPLADRVFAKIDASGPCWLWTGACYVNGYGAIRVNRTTRVAHRVVYELLVGAIPSGHDLDHLCRVRHCVNPDHLEPVTRQTNVDRGAQRAGVQRKTHCVNGHAFTPDNTINQRTGRACRTCANEANRRYRKGNSHAA